MVRKPKAVRNVRKLLCTLLYSYCLYAGSHELGSIFVDREVQVVSEISHQLSHFWLHSALLEHCGSCVVPVCQLGQRFSKILGLQVEQDVHNGLRLRFRVHRSPNPDILHANLAVESHENCSESSSHY